MSQQRKAKLKKRTEHRQRREQKKHDLVDGALRRAGLADAFRRLPPSLQESWRGLIQPAPEVVLDASAAECEQALGIQRDFPPALRRWPVTAGHTVSYLDLLCFLIPLRLHAEAFVEFLREAGDDLQTAPCCHIVEFVSQLRTFMEQQEPDIRDEFIGLTWVTCLYNSKLDERMLWNEFRQGSTPGGKPVLQIVLHRKTPERVQLMVDERPRTAFRCYVPVGALELKAITWNARELGFPDDARDYPVFMQAHALEQVAKRAPCSKPIYPIVLSLLAPKFLPTSNNHFLVEHRHMNHKLGYFVGVRLADCVLLKTFLFLTMQGTPESELLYRKLRLTRSDIEYLRLDELAAFRDSEVRGDAALVKLLNECGCGHLLTLTAPDLPKEIPTGYANPLRQYLGGLDKFATRWPAPPTVSVPAK